MNEMKKMTIIMTLMLTSVFAMAQTSLWNGGKTVWNHGSGTENDPYLIESAENLAYLAYIVNKGYDTEGLHFRLTTDIDLNGSEDQPWIPIGIGDRWFNDDGCDRLVPYPPANNCFRGHFDGADHSIANIYVDVPFTAGLFGHVEGKVIDVQEVVPAVIENVFVTCGTIKGENCGGIVGNGSATTLVSRCWNGAAIEGRATGLQTSVGGIVGIDALQVKNCYNLGELSGYIVGGIVGGGQVDIESCYNEGDMIGTFSGGIYGYAMSKNVVINNCYNRGEIIAEGAVPVSIPAGPSASGIAGFLLRSNGSITNCYNVGTISSSKDADCVLLYSKGNLTLENNSYINTCGEGEGQELSLEYMRSQEFVDVLNGGNRNPIWGLDENNNNDGFPILIENNLSVGEASPSPLTIYPNPTHGQFTVEGYGVVRVTNMFGQTLITRKIDGRHSFVLPQGLYFVTLNGETAKILVE